MNTDVDTRIREALHAALDRTEVPHERDPAGFVRRAMDRRREQRRARRLAMGSALCISIIAALTVVVRNYIGDAPHRVRTVKPPAAATSEQPHATTTPARPARVAIGRIILTLPEGFTIERQESLDYANGVTGRSVLIRREPTPKAEGARCQVAWLTFPANAFPSDTRAHSTIRIEPVDGSAPFSMTRTEGSDTDLGATIGDTESFSVDCDDLPTARLVATHLTIPTTTTTFLSAKPCGLDDLALDYYGGGGATGNDFGMIRIRDTAASPCLLRGPIVITGTNVAGRAVTHAVSYPVVPDLVLTPHAPRVPVEEVAPPGEHVADLAISAHYRDDPASSDGLCWAHRVIPSFWEVTMAGATKRVRNASYDPRNPTNKFTSLVTCYGQINTPDPVYLDD